MPYYRPCPLCGAALDPGERCDCQDIEKATPGAATPRVAVFSLSTTDEQNKKMYERLARLNYTKILR